MTAPQPLPTIDALFEQQGVRAVTHSCIADAKHVAELHPAEFDHVRTAITSRQHEFGGGRACAHASLQALDVDPSPLVATSDRSPVWPTGSVGSITHTQGYCLASACVERGVSIGIDAEQVGRVTDEVARIALSDNERQWVAQFERPDLAATIVFAAKEALYKAQHPITGQWLGFDDVDVTLDDRGEVITLDLVSGEPPAADLVWPFTARWTLLDLDDGAELVAAAVALRVH